MKYSDLLAMWRMRCGLAQSRDTCSLDYSAGINIDSLLHSRIADWYVRLALQYNDAGLLIPSDISADITVTMNFDRSRVEVLLPRQCLRPVSVSIENLPCTIIDRHKHPRVAELALAPLPGVVGPTDGLEAVYDRDTNMLMIPFCRSTTPEKVSCSALMSTPMTPTPDYDFPVTESALALLPDTINLF